MIMNPDQSKLCAGCKDCITDKKYVVCTHSGCDKLFHFLCVGLRSPASDSWVCPDCRSSMRKGGDNSATPVRTSENITHRKKKPASPLEQSRQESSPLSELTGEIRFLRAEVSSMKAEFETAISALKRCETRLDELSLAMSAYDTRLSAAERKASEVDDLRCVIEVLNDKLNTQEQSMLRTEIEVTGVMETQNENPHHIILTMSSLIGVKLTDSDVDNVQRVGPRRSTGHTLPRPLVVRFTRRAPRDQFLKAAKVRRLTTKDVGPEGAATTNIYVNERLTRANRLLFRDCRRQVKEAGFKFCWTSGGVIYAKKCEGKGRGAESFVVRSNADINRILRESESGSKYHI